MVNCGPDAVCIMMALSGDENYRYNHTGLVAGAWYDLDLEQVEQEGVVSIASKESLLKTL